MLNKTNEPTTNILILGGGRDLWNDYMNGKKFFDRYHIMCVNDIAGQFKCEPIQHIVSLHPRIIPAIVALRKEKGMIEKVTTYSNVTAIGVDRKIDFDTAGTSGLFSLGVATQLGYKRIILCGIPMDNTGHYFDPPVEVKNQKVKHLWTNFESKHSIAQIKNFKLTNPLIKNNVRSMSGITAEYFGKPTVEWANGNN